MADRAASSQAATRFVISVPTGSHLRWCFIPTPLPFNRDRYHLVHTPNGPTSTERNSFLLATLPVSTAVPAAAPVHISADRVKKIMRTPHLLFRWSGRGNAMRGRPFKSLFCCHRSRMCKKPLQLSIPMCRLPCAINAPGKGQRREKRMDNVLGLRYMEMQTDRYTFTYVV